MYPQRLAFLLAAGALVAVAPVAMGGAPAGWLVLLALASAAGASFGAVGRRVSLVGLGMAAYVGGMALAWSALAAVVMAAAALAVSLAAFWLRQERSVLVVTHAAVAAALGLIWAVLVRSGIPGAAAQTAVVLGSLSLAALAALCWHGLARLAPSPRFVPLTAAVLCGVGALVGGAQVPAWRQEVDALKTPAHDHETHVRLQRLRAAGFRDAALAWVGLAEDAAFEPRLLARICPTHHRQTTLSPAWQPWIALGEQTCARLAQAGGRAAEAGVAEIETATPATWAAWNQALALWLARAPAQAGVRFRGMDPRYAVLLDPDAGVYVLAVVASHGVEAHLPPTPNREVPRALRLTLRGSPSVRVVVTGGAGDALTFACGAGGSPAAERLDAQACRGRWNTIRLALAGRLQPPLTDIALSGELMLAEAQAEWP